MKKSLLMLLAAILTAGLVACGSDDETSDGLSSEEVFEKAFEAMDDMESATMEIDIEQEIEAAEEDFNITMGMRSEERRVGKEEKEKGGRWREEKKGEE